MGWFDRQYGRLMRAWAADPQRGVTRRTVHRLLGMVPADREAECMYGNLPGATGNCRIVVPPHAGWRRNGMVFCSDEHAAVDQEEQIL